MTPRPPWLRRVARGFQKFARRKIVFFGVALVTAYHTTMDIYGESWPIFSEYPALHSWLFLISVSAVLILAGVQAFIEDNKDQRLEQTEAVTLGFIDMVGRVVQNKLTRLKAQAVTCSTKKFNHFIFPSEQLTALLTFATDYLSDIFDLGDDQIDITVLAKNPTTNQWFLGFRHQSTWKHGDITPFVSKGGCAEIAHRTGHYRLYPSKELAAQEQHYVMAYHDTEGDGSIFAYPVSIDCSGIEHCFVISIVSYKKRLCDADDTENRQKVEGLLKEICRRIELELCFKVIEDYKPASKP